MISAQCTVYISLTIQPGNLEIIFLNLIHLTGFVPCHPFVVYIALPWLIAIVAFSAKEKYVVQGMYMSFFFIIYNLLPLPLKCLKPIKHLY